MNKAALIETVCKAAECRTKKQAAAAVETVFDTITKALSRGEEVSIAGFGIFKTSKRAARTGRNPKTGERIQIPARTRPKFRAGTTLKNAVK